MTPCAADLPFGAHRLRFAPIGDEEDGQTNVMVDVGAKPSVFRVAPAHRHVNEGGQFAGAFLATLGGTAMGLRAWSEEWDGESTNHRRAA